MAQYFSIHAENPQARLINQAVDILNNGGVIAYPTDSSYALGCVIGNKEAQTRIRSIRGVDEHHHFNALDADAAALAEVAVDLGGVGADVGVGDDGQSHLVRWCGPCQPAGPE